MYLINSNSSTASPTSTLDRQQRVSAEYQQETPLSQVVLTTDIGGPIDQIGYTVVSTENCPPPTISPNSLSLDEHNRDDLPLSLNVGNDDSSSNAVTNPYSAILPHREAAYDYEQQNEATIERKAIIEVFDPHSGKYNWSYPLYACCNDNESMKWCLLSTICPCYVAGRVAEAAGDNGIACCMIECLCPISCFFGALVRRKIRLQRSIVGETVEDLFLTCCCRPCALVQQAREQNLPILQIIERS